MRFIVTITLIAIFTLLALYPLQGSHEYLRMIRSGEAKNIAEAEAHLMKAVEMDPGKTSYQFRVALLSMARGKPVKASQWFEKAIHEYNGDSIPWKMYFAASNAQFGQGALFQARESLREAVRLYPGYPEGLGTLKRLNDILTKNKAIQIRLP